jgi:adenine deaminase
MALTALQSATLNPAKALHAADSLGTVAPGKLADLVLLDATSIARPSISYWLTLGPEPNRSRRRWSSATQRHKRHQQDGVVTLLLGG